MPSYYNLILWNLEPVKMQISKDDFLAMVNELDEKVDISRHQITRSIDLAKLTKLKNAEEKKWLCHHTTTSFYGIGIYKPKNSKFKKSIFSKWWTS